MCVENDNCDHIPDESDNVCPECGEDILVMCKVDGCGYHYPKDGYCLQCDELDVPNNTECEYCENQATHDVQGTPVCYDHHSQAYGLS